MGNFINYLETIVSFLMRKGLWTTINFVQTFYKKRFLCLLNEKAFTLQYILNRSISKSTIDLFVLNNIMVDTGLSPYITWGPMVIWKFADNLIGWINVIHETFGCRNNIEFTQVSFIALGIFEISRFFINENHSLFVLHSFPWSAMCNSLSVRKRNGYFMFHGLRKTKKCKHVNNDLMLSNSDKIL